jgi:hypothetical protein
MRETASTKATRYLTEGRFVITSVQQNRVTSSCRGEGHIWLQAYSDGVWRCTCPVVTDQCSHLLALRRVVDLEDHR